MGSIGCSFPTQQRVNDLTAGFSDLGTCFGLALGAPAPLHSRVIVCRSTYPFNDAASAPLSLELVRVVEDVFYGGNIRAYLILGALAYLIRSASDGSQHEPL